MPQPILLPSEFSAGTNNQIAENDPRVQPLIDGATTAIRRYCGWHIAGEVTESVTIDGPGGFVLQLPSLNVASVASIMSDGDPVTDFDVSPKGMVERRDGSCWSSRFGGVVVQMTHGFESAPDVKQIIQQVVANAISSSLGATKEQAGQLSISWSLTAPNVAGGISLLERDLKVLDSYRLPRLT